MSNNLRLGNICVVCGRKTYNKYICCSCEYEHQQSEEQVLEKLKLKGYI